MRFSLIHIYYKYRAVFKQKYNNEVYAILYICNQKTAYVKAEKYKWHTFNIGILQKWTFWHEEHIYSGARYILLSSEYRTLLFSHARPWKYDVTFGDILYALIIYNNGRHKKVRYCKIELVLHFVKCYIHYILQ